MTSNILKLALLPILLIAISCAEQSTDTSQEEIPHYLRKDNFTVLRVIIQNDKDQILMVGGEGWWGMPYINLSKRQFLKEAIDSMALEHGIELENIEFRGQFCFKYDYKPNMTFRNYYVAQYKSGEIKVPKNTLEDEFLKIEWVDTKEAIERNGNTGIREITRHILNNPDAAWGGSFLVSHTEDDHPTVMVEDFYPLFARENHNNTSTRNINPDYFEIAESAFKLYREDNSKWFISSDSKSSLYLVPYTDYSITTAILTNEKLDDLELITLLEHEGIQPHSQNKSIEIDEIKSSKGIKLGMQIHEVKEIFGTPTKSRNKDNMDLLNWNFSMLTTGESTVGGLKPFLLDGLAYEVEMKFYEKSLATVIYKYQVP